ncbi:swi5-like zinc finger protein [Mortierella sp. GBA35]|nr:swi5-like zinc finger protein [Mortierella sp. GBA35]
MFSERHSVERSTSDRSERSRVGGGGPGANEYPGMEDVLMSTAKPDVVLFEETETIEVDETETDAQVQGQAQAAPAVPPPPRETFETDRMIIQEEHRYEQEEEKVEEGPTSVQEPQMLQHHQQEAHLDTEMETEEHATAPSSITTTTATAKAITPSPTTTEEAPAPESAHPSTETAATISSVSTGSGASLSMVKALDVGKKKRESKEQQDALKAQEDAKIEELKKTIADLQRQEQEIIRQLRGVGTPSEMINRHIQQLHEYNETKDVGQVILGKCAELEGTTIKKQYEKFGLEMDD